MRESAKSSDYFKLHLSVLIWGFTAILGLLITIPSVEIVFYRTAIAALGLGVLLYLKKTPVKIGGKEMLKVGGTGLIIAAHWILFFAAARVSTASVCLAGMATCTLWTSFLETMLNRTKVKGFEVFLGLTVIGGLYIIFRFEFNHALGLSMAIASAFLSALFSVINGKIVKKHDPYVITYYEMIGACLGTAAFFPLYIAFFQPEGLQLIPTSMDWLWLSILALVCTIYPFSVTVEIMKRISAYVINLTINLEPVYGIILAVLVFGEKEKMETGFYIGTLVILLSVLAYPLFNRYYHRRAYSVNSPQ